MFAVVRTGGKQYRVAAGDKIAVEKLAGDAGDTITLGDVLLAGEGGDLQDAGKVLVSAEIIAQAKSEKVTVFKKRRRHNYRRKAGHRQQMTLLRIVAVGDDKYTPNKPERAAADAEAAPAAEAPQSEAAKAQAAEPAKGVDVVQETGAKAAEPLKNAATAAKSDAGDAAGADDQSAAEAPAAKKPAAKKPAAKKPE